MNPVFDQTNAQVDRVQSKDDLWKLGFKILLAALITSLGAVGYMYHENKELRKEHENSVTKANEKTDNLAKVFQEHLLEDIDRNRIDKDAWKEAEKNKGR